eukprot:552977-Prymnesium_polylepis.1
MCTVRGHTQAWDMWLPNIRTVRGDTRDTWLPNIRTVPDASQTWGQGEPDRRTEYSLSHGRALRNRCIKKPLIAF